MPAFDAWYATLLGEREIEVRRLINDGGAVRFLIAWSLFESRCFKDSANEREIRDLSGQIVLEGFDATRLSEPLEHFYKRYQDKLSLRHLQYGEQIRLCTEAMQSVISHVECSRQRAAA